MRTLGYLLLSLGTILATVAIAPVPELEEDLEEALDVLAWSAVEEVDGARALAAELTGGPSVLRRDLLADLGRLREYRDRPQPGDSAPRLRGALERAEEELRPLLEKPPLADRLAWIEERLADPEEAARRPLLEAARSLVAADPDGERLAEAAFRLDHDGGTAGDLPAGLLPDAGREDPEGFLELAGLEELRSWEESVAKRSSLLVRRLQSALPGFPHADRFEGIRRLGRGLDARRSRLRAGLEQLGPAAGPWLERLSELDERVDTRLAAVAAPLRNPLWTMFLAGVGLMGVGIVLARRAASGPGGEEDGEGAGAGAALEALGRIVSGTRDLLDRLESLDDLALHRQLDALQTGPIFDFVAAREGLLRDLGLARFAEAMAQFAIGERALNRAWTALADGYGQEARVSCRDALPFLEDASRLAGAAPAGE